MTEQEKALISRCFFSLFREGYILRNYFEPYTRFSRLEVCVSEVITTNEQDVLIQHMVDRLPALRKKYGISQTELGEKIGLSRQTISAIERKTTPLTWTTMLAMLMFFTANST